MNNTARLWSRIAEELVTSEQNQDFLDDVYDRFGDIFDIKDVTEYKNCALIDPFFAPSQFQYLSLAIRRAFVEGYLLAMTEHKKNQMKLLYNCYSSDPEEIPDDEKINDPAKRPRAINEFIALGRTADEPVEKPKREPLHPDQDEYPPDQGEPE